MLHVPHAFQHVRRLVLSAPMLLHPQTLTIPIVPWLEIQVQRGSPFGVYSYPKRYAAPNELHGLRGEVLIEIVIPF